MARKIILLILVFFASISFGARAQAQALWQLSLAELTIFYGDTVLFYLKNSQITTVDSHTGETLWQRDFDLVQADTYTVLPVAGEGLIFIPENKTLLALNERTGEIIWSYETSESITEKIEDTNNRVGIAYDQGYLFVQTNNFYSALDAQSGQFLWQQAKENRFVKEVKVLTDKYLSLYTESILDLNVAHRPTEINDRLGIYRLSTGEWLWYADKGLDAEFNHLVHFNDDFTDVYQGFLAEGRRYLNRFKSETGELIKSCVIHAYQNRIDALSIEPVQSALFDRLTVTEDWLYTIPDYRRTQQKIFSISRIPYCTERSTFFPSEAEPLSDTLERYYLPTLLYYDISPFKVGAGPYHGFYLFEASGQLFRVPVPQESFTYLYHDKTDDSLYIELSFTDISPPPYELIPGIEDKVVKAELLDGLLLVVLEDGTFQVINFDSLETVLKIPEAFLSKTTRFHKLGNILLVEQIVANKLKLEAFSLPY